MVNSLYYSSRKIPERCENSFVNYRINYQKLGYSLRRIWTQPLSMKHSRNMIERWLLRERFNNFTLRDYQSRPQKIQQRYIKQAIYTAFVHDWLPLAWYTNLMDPSKAGNKLYTDVMDGYWLHVNMARAICNWIAMDLLRVVSSIMLFEITCCSELLCVEDSNYLFTPLLIYQLLGNLHFFPVIMYFLWQLTCIISNQFKYNVRDRWCQCC